MAAPRRLFKSCESSSDVPIVRIAILAAGQASRFGANKLLQPWRGKPLLSCVLEAATQACPNNVFLVSGADADNIASICAEFAVDTVLNPNYASGMGTSIAAAARACEGSADGMLLLLGDQPLVTAAHLSELIESWHGDPHRICASRYSDTLGPPVLFGSSCFERLAELNGDQGAKGLIENSDSVVAIDFPPAAIDIDRLDDLSELDKFESESE